MSLVGRVLHAKYARIKKVNPSKVKDLLSLEQYRSKDFTKTGHMTVTVKILRDPALTRYNAVLGVEVDSYIHEGQGFATTDTYVLVNNGSHHSWVHYVHNVNNNSPPSEKDILLGDADSVAIHKGTMSGTKVRELLNIIREVDNGLYNSMLELYKWN